ncbi:Nn.00g001660.m01.CDS01 [Neocucurbitaria sp. VM-36]
MPLSMVQVECVRPSGFECKSVAVQICDGTKQHRKHIADISMSLIKRFAPEVLHLVEFDPQNDSLTLPLCLHSLEHAHDIEIPALARLFAHWRSNVPLTHPSIGETVTHYRALQVLLNPQAEHLRSIIMLRLRTEPVVETDAQIIWWALVQTTEYYEWLDALFYNLVRFSVFQQQPTGGYIQLFIETELLRLNEKAYERVLSIYRRHQATFESGTNARLSRFWRRAVRHLFCVSV